MLILRLQLRIILTHQRNITFSQQSTKKEIEERKSSEVKPITDDIFPPPYLSTKKQKEEFNKIDNQRSCQSDFIIQIV